MNDTEGKTSTHSYVEPRMPSITGFGPRRKDGNPKKLLEYSLEKNNDLDIPKIEVCLRIKPRSSIVPIGDNTLSILNDNTVACSNGNAREGVTEYTFSSVFGPSVDQKNFFDIWVYDKVLRFLNGNNELLFAYGTTNAGKTYTIHGSPTDPGIIPRTLVTVFNTLKNEIIPTCKYKPDKVIAAHILDESLMKNEEEIRNNIFNNWSNGKIEDEFKSYTLQTDESQTLSSMQNFTSNNLVKMFGSLKDNVVVPSLNHGNVGYSVWVTYSEIYNETIYDLLVTHTANQKRIPLKLSVDQDKCVYIRNLTHVCVRSAEEAYKVMTFGKNNLKIASNNLNKSSSRSHCIFTLKLMRLERIENPETSIISSISFCDLAGSERLKKTLNVGDRLKESKNINTSLMVLNKCFSVLRENQKRGENMVVPYRESKLTQMFQTALSGNSKTGISMAVNVDMSPNLLEETKQVLFMSSIVRCIIKTKSKSVNKPKPSFAIWANNRKSITQNISKQITIMEDDINLSDTNYEKNAMMRTDKDYQLRLDEEQVKLRLQLVAQFKTIMDNNAAFHKKQNETMLKNNTEFYENKIERLKAYYLDEIHERDKKLMDLHGNNDVSSKAYDDTRNKSQMENYEFQIGELKCQKDELLGQLNELKKVNGLAQEDIKSIKEENEDLKKVKDSLQEDIKSLLKENEDYKTMLDEAFVEYQQQNNELNKMSQNIDEYLEEMKLKDLEIERLTGSLDVKEDIITDMEKNQEIMEQEKLEVIQKRENTIQKLKIKLQNCQEEKSELAMRYKDLKQLYLKMTKVQELNESLQSKLSEKEGEIIKLREHIEELEPLKSYKSTIKELQHTINVLKSTSIKSETNSITVKTDLHSVQLPVDFTEDTENKFIKSEPRPPRKCKTKTSPLSMKKNTKISKKENSDSFEKMIDKAIENIPTSTKKRRLFDNKPPFADSSNILSNSTMDSIISPSRSLHQVTRLRVKK